MTEFVIRALHRADWASVREIYEEGIATGHATFETSAPDWESWDLGHVRSCRLVAGLWTLQAGIFPENVGSIRIHEKCGFRALGVRERLGKLAGVWRDVVLLERRSPAVGKE